MNSTNSFGNPETIRRAIYGTKKKRVRLTPGQRIFVWEHPKLYGRTCSICHQRITKASEMEFDHTKPHSKGGKKQAIAHNECNKLKASGSLTTIQTTLGIKPTKRKRVGVYRRKKRKAKRKPQQRGENYSVWKRLKKAGYG